MPIVIPTRGYTKLIDGHPLTRDFRGCWRLDEGTGAKIFDSSGHQTRYLGDFAGPMAWTAGKRGHALYFYGDAPPAYVKLQLWDGGPKVTLFARVKFEQAVGANEQIATADSTTSGLRAFQFRRTTTGKLQFIPFVGDTPKTVTGDTVLTTGKWWDVVGVNDGSYSRVYVNGVEDGTPFASGNMDADAAAWAMGARVTATSWSGVVDFLEGRIEFLMRWDRALSASEIALICREPSCRFERTITPGLIGSQIINFAGASAALSSLSATAKAIRKVGGTVPSTSDVAALLNSIRGEESSLGIERSWLKEALFNGMTANAFKLGTTLSLGWFWVRVAGCSVLYRGPSMERIDFTNILTVAEQNASEISPPSYIPHNNSSTYFYVIRRFSNCGYQELTLAAAAKVSIDANGELEKPQPSNIFSSKAEQVDGNKIQLVWFYCPLEQKSQPVCFNVYYDGGMGQIDYENPLAKISYEGRRFYSYQSGALGAGGYLFAIRAEDADGVENSSSAQLKIQLDTTNPDAIDILSTETV
ncbi:hypothetical protein ES703_18997 [subsurface metagenome]